MLYYSSRVLILFDADTSGILHSTVANRTTLISFGSVLRIACRMYPHPHPTATEADAGPNSPFTNASADVGYVKVKLGKI
jgi:hypothetical protein